jgi:homoserine dehydrogenase
MSSSKTINIVIFGIGNIGSTVIKQINSAKVQLQQQQKLNIRIPIITNSRIAFFYKEGITDTWESDFEKFSVPYKIQDIITYIRDHNYENLIAIDTTASQEFVKHYTFLIENGFHIVSANKVANTLHYDFYKQLRTTLKKYNKQFLYETNVGAGLPVIATIKSLYDSGESIKKIKGVFSGSLSYIFNEFSKEDLSFSKVINNASRLGLTEPDAREDLSGKDVARKLLILARELGINKELNEVSLESLVPKNLNGNTTPHQFKLRSKELDIPFQIKKQKLLKNEVLRYVAELDVPSNTLQVKLVAEDKNSALGQLKGSDSLFEIFAESYKDSPLVIQGAGAGKVVTARGVFSDILKLSNSLN